MQKKTIASFIVISLFLFLNLPGYALSDEREKSQHQQTPEMKGYNYNLKELLEKVEKNLKEAEKKLKEEEVKKRNEEREAEIRKHFEKGNQLYQEGKFKEAKQEWQKALGISNDPEIRDYIKKAESRAKEEELVRRKEEQERQKKLEAETREKKRQEVELKKQQEQLAREQKLKQESEAKEQERLEKEKQKQLTDEQKQQERIKKQEEVARQKELAKKQQEEERLAKQKEVARQKEEQERQKTLTAERKEKERQEELAQKEQERKQKQLELDAKRKAQQEPKKKVAEPSVKPIPAAVKKDLSHLGGGKGSVKPVPTAVKDSRTAREEEFKRKKEEQEQQKRLAAEAREKELKLNEQAKAIYNEAVSLYRAGDYEQAQTKFAQAAKLIPHYSRTDNYLERIPQDIQKERERLAIEKKQEEELIQVKKIDSIYKNAIALYNKNQFEKASLLFNQILSLDPEHRIAKDYLNKKIPNRIKQLEIAKQREEKRGQIAEQKRSEKQIQEKQELKKESKVESKDKKIDAKVEESESILNETARTIYKEAIALYNSRKYTQAKVKFEQLKQIAPNHPNTDYYLERIPQKIAEHKEWTEAQNKQEKETTKRKKIASLSNNAISFYDEGKLAEAAALFKQILLLDPENKRAKYYLENKIPSDITKLPESAQEKQDMEKVEKERLEVEKKRSEELARNDKEREQKEELKRKKEEQKEKKRLAAEAREKERSEKGKQRQPELQKEESERKQKEKELAQQRKINSLYKEAISLYNHDQLDEAKVFFLKILSLDPTEQGALDYIKNKIPERTKELQKQ